MRPTWGMDILSTVWSIGAELDLAMQEAVETRVQGLVPEVRGAGDHRLPST